MLKRTLTVVAIVFALSGLTLAADNYMGVEQVGGGTNTIYVTQTGSNKTLTGPGDIFGGTDNAAYQNAPTSNKLSVYQRDGATVQDAVITQVGGTTNWVVVRQTGDLAYAQITDIAGTSNYVNLKAQGNGSELYLTRTAGTSNYGELQQGNGDLIRLTQTAVGSNYFPNDGASPLAGLGIDQQYSTNDTIVGLTAGSNADGRFLDTAVDALQDAGGNNRLVIKQRGDDNTVGFRQTATGGNNELEILQTGGGNTALVIQTSEINSTMNIHQSGSAYLSICQQTSVGSGVINIVQ